jgi:hypothetical protein
MLFLWRS